ncbi:MAG: SDR family oxidoreductase [bacterium]|nr:SDR family oxidoreductase [bacterium]
MSGKILIIGATGNVGSELVRLLLEKDERVVAAVRNPKTAEAMHWKAVEVAQFDYTQPETIQGLFDGVEKMFMISLPFDSRAVELELPVIDRAKRAGVRHIVKMSAMGVENVEQAPMRMVEKYLEKSGLDYTFIRPNWFMQNFSAFLVETIKNQGAFYLPAGDAKTSFIDSRDIAAVVSTALTEEGHLGKAYALTGSEALDHHQVAEIISKTISKPVKYIAVSDDDTRKALKAQGWQDSAIEYMIMIYQIVRQGWMATISTTLKDIMGRDPITFEQFAKDHAEVWK